MNARNLLWSEFMACIAECESISEVRFDGTHFGVEVEDEDCFYLDDLEYLLDNFKPVYGVARVGNQFAFRVNCNSERKTELIDAMIKRWENEV